MKSFGPSVFRHRDSMRLGHCPSHQSSILTKKDTKITNPSCRDKIEEQNIRCSVSTKSKDFNRRIIFPSIHRSSSTPDTKAAERTHPVQIIKKSPSHNSLDISGATTSSPVILKEMIPLGREESPRTITHFDSCTLPLLPGLVEPTLDHKVEPILNRNQVKIDTSTMIIPPFKKKGDAPSRHILSEEMKMVEKRFTTLKREKPVTKRSIPKKKSFLESILRKEIQDNQDSVPSAVPLSESEDSLLKRVQFDPRVWVYQFQRDREEYDTTWYSATEMDQFKQCAIERVYNFTKLVPTGTGRFVRTPLHNSRAIFTNPALTGEFDDNAMISYQLSQKEVRRILIIDPHDLCAKLFEKSLKLIFPSADIAKAVSSSEAIRRIERGGKSKPFDLILVEERLKIVQGRDNHQNNSGSALIKLLKKKYKESIEKSRHAIFIGVSAHFEQDKDKLKKGGASLIWPKPAPPIDEEMRDRILRELLIAREKKDLLSSLE